MASLADCYLKGKGCVANQEFYYTLMKHLTKIGKKLRY